MIERIDLIEEQKRRLRDQKATYLPNPAQKKVHESLKQTRVMVGGNGVGKTALVVQEAMMSARGYNYITKKMVPVPRRVVVVLDKPDKVQDKWKPEIHKWYNVKDDQFFKHGKPYYTRIAFDNGSEIKFMFHDQDPLTFESLEADDVLFDEPPPRNVYIALLRGMRNRNKQQRILFAFTAITGGWIRREIVEPWARGELDDTECFKFSTRENEKNLPDGYVEWYSKKLSEKERRIRIEGDFFDLEGSALAHLFDRKIHVVTPEQVDWDDNNPCVVAIDCHPEKPHFACILGADKDNRLYYMKEMFIKSTPREFAVLLKEWYRDHRIVDIVCDSLGMTDTSGGEGFKSFIQVLREEGVLVRSTSYEDKKDEKFMMRIQDSLLIPEEPDNFNQRVPKLRIFEGNNGIINDIEYVQWAKDKKNDINKPKLEIGNRDFLATLKYALAAGLYFKKGKTKIFRKKIPKTYGQHGPGPRYFRKRLLAHLK